MNNISEHWIYIIAVATDGARKNLGNPCERLGLACAAYHEVNVVVVNSIVGHFGFDYV